MAENKSTPPGVARQQVTFIVLPRKVTQRHRPRFAAPAGYPALLVWSGGCGTRTACSNITSDLAEVFFQPSRMASCFISARLNLRSLAADRGGAQGKEKLKFKTLKSDFVTFLTSTCHMQYSIYYFLRNLGGLDAIHHEHRKLILMRYLEPYF